MRGFSIAALFIGNGFGALWLGWAISDLAGPNAPVWPAYAVALGLFAVSVWRLGVRRTVTPRPEKTWARGLAYLLIVFGEILALNFLVYELQAHGLLGYLHPTIGLVIGLHFFPLARLFKMPAMNLLGAVMVGAAAAAFGAASLGVPPRIAIGLDALVNGFSLLATTFMPRRRPV